MDERGEKLEKLYERPLSASWALNGKGRVHLIHICNYKDQLVGLRVLKVH